MLAGKAASDRVSVNRRVEYGCLKDFFFTKDLRSRVEKGLDTPNWRVTRYKEWNFWKINRAKVFL